MNARSQVVQSYRFAGARRTTRPRAAAAIRTVTKPARLGTEAEISAWVERATRTNGFGAPEAGAAR